MNNTKKSSKPIECFDIYGNYVSEYVSGAFAGNIYIFINYIV
jgi:hypothetical protein